MVTPAGWLMLRATVLAMIPLAACSPSGPAAGGTGTTPQRTPGPAAPVPTLTIGETQAGTPVVAEAGDHVEVRLPASETGEPWQFVGQTGVIVTFEGARLETSGDDGDHGTPVQVFRFSTAAAGQTDLRFARGVRSLTFIIDVR